jgi:hypothetical protein
MARSQVKNKLKTENFEIFFCRNFFSNIYFFSIGHQRPSNSEYIAGEKIFLDLHGAQGSHPKVRLPHIGKTHFYP